MELNIYQIDAFTDIVFKGNPAAVIPLDNWLPPETMQALALENNLSETVFFVPTPNDPAHDFHIRWFTPTVEADICGHATLAASWVLFNKLGFADEEIRFATNEVGSLFVKSIGDKIELNFPVQAGVPASIPEGLNAVLGCEVVEFLEASKAMAVLKTADDVRNCKPDLSYIEKMVLDGLIITAKGDNCDCVSRYFVPQGGVDEDPVTGSAHCTVIPYWADKLDKVKLHAKQVSARGGDLYCQLVGERVYMQGDAVLYLEGRVYL